MDRRTLDNTLRDALDRHRPLLQKLVRGFATEADRDDLMQEIVIALWHALPHFRGDAALSTFLYRVALNTALAWKRRLRQIPTIDDADAAADAACDRPGPLQQLDAEHQRAMLESGIARLAAIDRALLILHREDVAYAEIADVLGISVSNVGARLTRIRQKLARMQDNGELT